MRLLLIPRMSRGITMKSKGTRVLSGLVIRTASTCRTLFCGTHSPGSSTPVKRRLRMHRGWRNWYKCRSMREHSGKALENLIGTLREGERSEIPDAARRLGTLGARAIFPLMQVLRDPDLNRRWRAAAAFVHIGKCAVPRLIQAIQEESWPVRSAAIYALEQIGDRRAVPALIAALYGKTMECRYMAAAALKKIGGHEGLSALKRALDLDWKMRGMTWGS